MVVGWAPGSGIKATVTNRITNSYEKNQNSRIKHFLCSSSREGWYRFMGEAGTHLVTTSPGAFAPGAGTLKEVCGTSYVGWMNGQHPKVHEGIVTRCGFQAE
jgi:hypothetical protein